MGGKGWGEAQARLARYCEATDEVKEDETVLEATKEGEGKPENRQREAEEKTKVLSTTIDLH